MVIRSFNKQIKQKVLQVIQYLTNLYTEVEKNNITFYFRFLCNLKLYNLHRNASWARKLKIESNSNSPFSGGTKKEKEVQPISWRKTNSSIPPCCPSHCWTKPKWLNNCGHPFCKSFRGYLFTWHMKWVWNCIYISSMESPEKLLPKDMEEQCQQQKNLLEVFSM